MRKGRPERVIPFAALAEVNAGRSIRATATKFDIGYGTLWQDARRHGLDTGRNSRRRYVINCQEANLGPDHDRG